MISQKRRRILPANPGATVCPTTHLNQASGSRPPSPPHKHKQNGRRRNLLRMVPTTHFCINYECVCGLSHASYAPPALCASCFALLHPPATDVLKASQAVRAIDGAFPSIRQANASKGTREPHMYSLCLRNEGPGRLFVKASATFCVPAHFTNFRILSRTMSRRNHLRVSM
jgi:hypothetical protein